MLVFFNVERRNSRHTQQFLTPLSTSAWTNSTMSLKSPIQQEKFNGTFNLSSLSIYMEAYMQEIQSPTTYKRNGSEYFPT